VGSAHEPTPSRVTASAHSDSIEIDERFGMIQFDRRRRRASFGCEIRSIWDGSIRSIWDNLIRAVVRFDRLGMIQIDSVMRFARQF
jgi:hypothetical protein